MRYHLWLDYEGDNPSGVLGELAVAARKPAASATVGEPVYLDTAMLSSRLSAAAADQSPSALKLKRAVRRASRMISVDGRGDVVGTAEHPFLSDPGSGSTGNVVFLAPTELWVVTCVPHPESKQADFGLGRYPAEAITNRDTAARRSVPTGLSDGWHWYSWVDAGPKYKQVTAVIEAALAGAASAGAHTHMVRF